MKTFKNILYYVGPGEGDSAALGHAISLARRNNCPLKILSVVEPVSWLMSRVIPGHMNLDGMIVDNLNAVHEELADRARAEGLYVSTVIRRGRPFLEIIYEVLEHDHDLVIKAAQGDATSGGSLGPTALHLMRKCPCPVWVITEGTDRFRKVLAPVQVGEEEPEQAQLQRRIVELAKSVSETYDADLTVVHAWSLLGEGLLRKRMDPDDLHKAVVDARDRSSEHMQVLAEEMSLEPDRVKLIKGFHGQVIADYVKEVGTDLVVMGTVSRTGVPGLLIGNTAERVLKTLGCSVLAVKPEGFVTPITLPQAESA